MPGLKKEQKSLGNIKAMMESNPTPAIQTQVETETGEKHYAKIFEKIGTITRNKYEAGNPPRLHRQFFNALVEALDGKKKGHINITLIIDKLETSRSVAIAILSCLEAYGYISVRPEKNVKGKMLIFEILREMP